MPEPLIFTPPFNKNEFIAYILNRTHSGVGETPFPITSQSSQIAGVILGTDGEFVYVKYTFSLTGTGAAANFPFFVPRPHKMALFKAVVTNSASSATDTTGTQITMRTIVPSLIASGIGQTIFASSNPIGADSVSFEGGRDFVEDANTDYVILINVPNTDIVYCTLIIGYM